MKFHNIKTIPLWLYTVGKKQDTLDEWKIQIKLGLLMLFDDNPFETETILSQVSVNCVVNLRWLITVCNFLLDNLEYFHSLSHFIFHITNSGS